VGHLRYHEIDELRAGVKRTVSDRRLRVANNVRVRRASVELSTASEIDEVFTAIQHMLEFGEFSFANLQVGQVRRADLTTRILEASARRNGHNELELQNGRIYWSWTGKSSTVDESARATTSWCFRLPLVKDGIEWGWMNLYRDFGQGDLLVDTNYLSEVFRHELTAATERIFALHDTAPAVEQMSLTASAGSAG
jgi:hypothetical protein